METKKIEVCHICGNPKLKSCVYGYIDGVQCPSFVKRRLELYLSRFNFTQAEFNRLLTEDVFTKFRKSYRNFKSILLVCKDERLSDLYVASYLISCFPFKLYKIISSLELVDFYVNRFDYGDIFSNDVLVIKHGYRVLLPARTTEILQHYIHLFSDRGINIFLSSRDFYDNLANIFTFDSVLNLSKSYNENFNKGLSAI